MIQHAMWNEIDNLRREMETIFNDLTSRTPVWTPVGQFLKGADSRYPSLQMCDDNEAVYVEVVMPGVAPESLDLSVEHKTLTLAGEKSQVFGENEPKNFHRQERITGKFTQRVPLPVEVATDQVSAEYANGVLKIKLPKAEKAKARQISIKAA